MAIYTAAAAAVTAVACLPLPLLHVLWPQPCPTSRCRCSCSSMHNEPAGQAAHLRLERRRANLAFSSWRLSSTLVHAQGSVALPAPVVPPQAADTDYVTARHAALLNGLTQQPRGCYLFLEGQQAAAGGTAALQLCSVELEEAGKPPRLCHVAGEWLGCAGMLMSPA